MGRVAKYKKVKSCDPYSKKNRGNIDLASVGVWGLGDNGRRVKKRSLKARKLHAKKNKNGKRNKNNDDDGGFDVPPTDGDEFDLADLVGSVRRRSTTNCNNNNNNKELLLGGGGSSDASGSNDHDDKKSSINNNNNNSNINGKHEKENDKNHHPREESYDRVVTSASTSNGKNLVVANIPRTDADEQAVERLLRVDKQLKQRSLEEKQKNHGRMEGESKRAYAKRTLAETRQIIKKSALATTTSNQEKRLKKKEFLSNKKKNKNKKRRMANGTSNEFVGFGVGDDGNGNDGNGNDIDIDNDNRCDTVGFGEQADRPPVFRQLPRGAKTREANSVATSTVRAHNNNNNNNNNNTTKGIMTEDQVEAESNAMELMRRRVQAQYRAIKSKRRTAGDFHL